MKHILRNFLPQDTRAVEFPSAFALFTVAILLAFGIIEIHPAKFWLVVTTIIGFLQLISLVQFPKMDTLRTACNWVTGTFWIWVAFSTPISIGTIVVFYLGFSNLMAFLINTTVLSETWKK